MCRIFLNPNVCGVQIAILLVDLTWNDPDFKNVHKVGTPKHALIIPIFASRVLWCIGTRAALWSVLFQIFILPLWLGPH